VNGAHLIHGKTTAAQEGQCTMLDTLPVPVAQDSAPNLTTLGATVRAELVAVGHATTEMLVHAFAIGDALIEAKKLAGHGYWLHWLANECGLSSRTARAYMQLAHHRGMFEANWQHAANLSIRGALRLIGGGLTMRKRRPASALRSASWKVASFEERKDFVGDIPVKEWLAVISRDQRKEIEDRIDGLRAAHAKPMTAVVHH
jgi:Protein of unknown function (DUF3102)